MNTKTRQETAGDASAIARIVARAFEAHPHSRGTEASIVRELGECGAAGCVVLGEPSCYGRSGFRCTPGLVYPGPPHEVRGDAQRQPA